MKSKRLLRNVYNIDLNKTRQLENSSGDLTLPPQKKLAF